MSCERILFLLGGGKSEIVHPTSKIAFSDIFIPSFDKIKQLVLKLHPMVPHFRLVSWDIAIDSDSNPVLIEANLCDGELDFHQMNNGSLFGVDTRKILDEVFSDKAKW